MASPQCSQTQPSIQPFLHFQKETFDHMLHTTQADENDN